MASDDSKRKMIDECMYTDDQDVVTLSPILEDAGGPQFHYGPFSGEVPADPLGYLTERGGSGSAKGSGNGKK